MSDHMPNDVIRADIQFLLGAAAKHEDLAPQLLSIAQRLAAALLPPEPTP